MVGLIQNFHIMQINHYSFTFFLVFYNRKRTKIDVAKDEMINRKIGQISG